MIHMYSSYHASIILKNLCTYIHDSNYVHNIISYNLLSSLYVVISRWYTYTCVHTCKSSAKTGTIWTGWAFWAFCFSMVAFNSSIFFSKLSYKYVNVIGQKQFSWTSPISLLKIDTIKIFTTQEGNRCTIGMYSCLSTYTYYQFNSKNLLGTRKYHTYKAKL